MNKLDWSVKRQHFVIDLSEEFSEVEVLFEKPLGAERVAVLCHPHPLYQGSMHSKVLVRLARACHAHQIATVRFHFPGVGKTQGVFGEGITELKLTQALCDYVLRSCPYQLVGVGGFSFGGGVALRVPLALPWIIALAPSLRGFESNIHAQSLLIAHAQDDEVVPFEDSLSCFSSLCACTKNLLVYQKAGHFFIENLDRLQTDLENWLSAQKY